MQRIPNHSIEMHSSLWNNASVVGQGSHARALKLVRITRRRVGQNLSTLEHFGVVFKFAHHEIGMALLFLIPPPSLVGLRAGTKLFSSRWGWGDRTVHPPWMHTSTSMYKIPAL